MSKKDKKKKEQGRWIKQTNFALSKEKGNNDRDNHGHKGTHKRAF